MSKILLNDEKITKNLRITCVYKEDENSFFITLQTNASNKDVRNALDSINLKNITVNEIGDYQGEIKLSSDDTEHHLKSLIVSLQNSFNTNISSLSQKKESNKKQKHSIKNN